MDVSAHFRGKKITLMGLGLLGRGVGDARFLAECGAELIVTDLKTKEQLASSLEILHSFPTISYTLGEHKIEDFRGRDLVIKAAGVPLDSPFIAEARKNGTPVRMSTDLFAELAGIPIIGVTGTRGKTTTTYLISETLTKAGKKVLLGGNIRGVSTLAFLSEATPEHVGVFELDSWQLQGFGEAHLSPQIAVFTTFFPDHLNYYANLDDYLADKAYIFLNQSAEDTLILGPQCADLIQTKYGSSIKSKVIIPEALPGEWTLKMPGEHNRYNASLALAAARAYGIEDEVSKEAIEQFNGVAGRLEFIREYNGVKIYNDTTATTPDATLVALKALSNGEPNIVLIMGGADKELDMRPLLEEIPIYCKSVVLLSGSGTSLIAPHLADAPLYDDLSSALTDALRRTTSGDVLLFSTAFSSKGMFKNEYDRGDEFNRLVQALI